MSSVCRLGLHAAYGCKERGVGFAVDVPIIEVKIQCAEIEVGNSIRLDVGMLGMQYRANVALRR